MRMKIGAALMLGMIVASPALAAGDPGEKLVHKYVAGWDIDGLLKEPVVAAGLNKIPAAQRAKLKTSLNVTSGVEYVGGHLRVEGNAPHSGGEEAAVLCVDPYGNKVQAAIFSKGAIQVYTTETRYDYLTTCVRDWIAVASTNFNIRFNKPASVQLLTVK